MPRRRCLPVLALAFVALGSHGLLAQQPAGLARDTAAALPPVRATAAPARAAGSAPGEASPAPTGDASPAPGDVGPAAAWDASPAPGFASPALGSRAGPAPARDTLRLYLGLEAIGPVFPFSLRTGRLPGSLWLRPRLEDWTAAWAATARINAARRLGTLAAGGPGQGVKAAPAEDCCDFLPPPHRDAGRGRNPLLPGAVADYADITMKLTGRGELGSAWTRYFPCDPSTPVLCNPTLFPQLKPDVQFTLRVAGTISDRVHVNVDYDQRREFGAANNINVFYQGLDDEVLQRLEVGDVSIALPASRYLTQGIPAGNFGFKATGQLGPLDFQAIWAQQRGDVTRREFRLNGGAGQSAGLVQDATITLDDADYVKGQFFYLVDPRLLAGAPHINPLKLLAGDAAPDVRPRGGTLVVYRDERPSATNQAQVGQLGYFMAEATLPGSPLRHSGFFRRLTPGDDYIVHSSGLWIVLRAPLRADEALAIGYVTERGDTVGSIDGDNAGRSGTPTLRLLRGPLSIHQPDQATWPYELHQVYRVDASSGVDPAGVDLTISLGQLSGGKTFTLAGGKQVTYLKLLGLDELPPADRLDQVQVYQPSPAGADGTSTGRIGGTYIVLPTLRPFAAPPPAPSAGLSAADDSAALGNDANRAIYDNPDPVVRESAARFRLTLSYRVQLGGLSSTLNLGALGIREGSEKLSIAGKPLANGKDYTIDYDLGTVTLLDPQAVFGANPRADIRATWEQKAAFQLAPTNIYGLNTRYRLGTRGELNFIGLYQAQKTIMARPQLGTEPSSIFLGGASGRLDLGGSALDALLAHVPGLHSSNAAKSAVSLTGEAAMSSPNPNTQGATYVDDFESADAMPIALTRQSWRLGSRPEDPSGAIDALPPNLDVASAMRLVWQHDYLDDQGRVLGSISTANIDAAIKAVGVARDAATQPVMWLTLGGDSMPAHAARARRWRSITTVLSATGRDMSRSEALEFYAAGEDGAALVFDLGSVSEDAYYFDRAGNLDGSYPNGKRWGLGVLDQEADVARREIWGTAADTLGLWNQDCRADRGKTYPLGDPRSNCTRGNGLIDTEDLNGDGLNPPPPDGAYFRFVVQLGSGSPYLVRDTTSTGTAYRLYRIPLHGPLARAVGGASDGTWRFIQDMRLTVADSVGRDPRQIRLTRMSIIGSRWAKRDLAGLESGLVGTDPQAGDTAAFQVEPVSVLTQSEYGSPPGTTDQLQDPTAQFNVGAAQIINEQSLRLAVRALGPNTRAEAYYRFPQQPRSFLKYRTLRLWAVARQGSWGANGDDRLLVKVGSDARNYYLYRARLHPPHAGKIASADWLPEIAIDFDQWFALRAQAERLLITSPPTNGPLAVWSPDSSYGIVLEDRARAPNLAAVREFSFAVYNGGIGAAPVEVWLDDLRLTGAMTDPGFAGNLTFDLRAGDFLTATASVASQGALYHQLNQEASYQRSRDAAVSGTAQLGLLMPSAWDLDAPLTVSWGKTGLRPQFLAGTDLPANQITDLRATGSDNVRVGFALRRRTPLANPWLDALVGGLSLRVGYTGASAGTATSLARSGGVDGGLSYDRRPAAREFGIMPGFLVNALRAVLPDRVQRGDMFQRLAGARLRWTPEAISFSSGYYDQHSDAFRYDQILKLPSDTVPAISSARMGLDNSARLSLHPFESLVASVAMGTTRDLLPPNRASDQLRVRQAIGAARSGIGGLALGWESNRNISTQLDWRPPVAAWLRPGFAYSARFRADRNASFLEVVPDGADSSAIMQRQFQADRQVTRTLQLDPGGFTDALLGGGTPRLLRGLTHAVQPLELTWVSALGSQFARVARDAGSGYQLGLGALEGWRFMGADTASMASSRDGLRGRTGVTLPFGTQLSATYDGTRTHRFDRNGGNRTEQSTTWPALQLTWPRIPLPPLLRSVVTQLGLSGGFQRAHRSSTFGAAGDAASLGYFGYTARGAGEETSVPVQLSVGLLSTLSATYNGSVTSGNASDPTGDIRRSGSNHTVSLSGFFKVPPSLRAQFSNPVQATLGLTSQADRQCHLQPGNTASPICEAFVDYRTRRINLSLDTQLSDLTVGFQMSYNSRKSNIGTLNGSSQFQMGIFGQFNIDAAQLAGARR